MYQNVTNALAGPGMLDTQGRNAFSAARRLGDFKCFGSMSLGHFTSLPFSSARDGASLGKKNLTRLSCFSPLISRACFMSQKSCHPSNRGVKTGAQRSCCVCKSWKSVFLDKQVSWKNKVWKWIINSCFVRAETVFENIYVGFGGTDRQWGARNKLESSERE